LNQTVVKNEEKIYPLLVSSYSSLNPRKTKTTIALKACMTQQTRVSRVVSNPCYSGSKIMTVLMQFDYGVHLPQRAWQLDMLAPGITSPKCVRVYMSIARPHLMESRPQFSDIQTHIKCEPTDVRKYLSRRCHCKACQRYTDKKVGILHSVYPLQHC